jgi:hypothetical protein
MFDEYHSTGYWLDAQERIDMGMCHGCGEYLKPEQICFCDKGFSSVEEANHESAILQSEYLAADWADAENGTGTYGNTVQFNLLADTAIGELIKYSTFQLGQYRSPIGVAIELGEYYCAVYAIDNDGETTYEIQICSNGQKLYSRPLRLGELWWLGLNNPQ